MTSISTHAAPPHRTSECNRLINSILARRLTAPTLSFPVALYGHSVFTQETTWSIDSFDRWGVDLGKALAQPCRRLRRSQS